MGRRTIAELCKDLNLSYPTLIKEFDSLDEIKEGFQEDALPYLAPAINLQIDATFFGREYGFLVAHNGDRVIYLKEIKTESVQSFREAIIAIKDRCRIISITIDGRRGYINNIRKLLGNIPIQMCLFHQKAIIRRYITDRPRTQCGMELKQLMKLLCKLESQQEFIDRFYRLKEKYHSFLHERHEQKYKHTGLRSAFRSLDQNMMYLFTYTDYKDLNIKPTTNHLEGLFGHVKERIKIHRGLDVKRKKKAVKFLLKNLGKK